ncbi:MAG: hypothetical protein ABI200_02005 [Gaiellales bacterium]
MKIFTALSSIALLALVFAVPASAETFSFTKNAKNVSVTMSVDSVDPESFEFRNLTIQIERDGVVVMTDVVAAPGCPNAESGCIPVSLTAKSDGDAFAVRNIDVDAEPEIILGIYTAKKLDMFSGYACCTMTRVYKWKPEAGKYVAYDKNFKNSHETVFTKIGTGKFMSFVGGDTRFTKKFAPTKYAYLPTQIFQFKQNRRFVDVSTSYKKQLQNDSKKALATARKDCRSGNAFVNNQSAYAAYAANEYRLGNRAKALRVLRAEGKKGCFKGGTARTRKTFVTRVDTYLKRIKFNR